MKADYCCVYWWVLFVKEIHRLTEVSVHRENKGADLFQKGGRTKKQAAGRGTSRYSIGIKS